MHHHCPHPLTFTQKARSDLILQEEVLQHHQRMGRSLLSRCIKVMGQV